MIKKSQTVFLALALAGLSLGACGDDDDTGTGTGADADTGSTIDAAVEYVCDPVGATPDQGELFNAPVDDDVEVIVKTPQHPGFPGPTDLP